MPEVKDKTLAEVFVKALGEFKNPERTGSATVITKSGDKYGYRYAELPVILDLIREVFTPHGLAFNQDTACGWGYAGAKSIITYDETGESIESSWYLLPAGPTAQTAGAATTYARRYSATAFVGIAGEDDVDGEGAVEKEDNKRPSSPDKPVAAPPLVAKGNLAPDAGMTRDEYIREIDIMLDIMSNGDEVDRVQMLTKHASFPGYKGNPVVESEQLKSIGWASKTHEKIVKEFNEKGFGK